MHNVNDSGINVNKKHVKVALNRLVNTEEDRPVLDQSN